MPLSNQAASGHIFLSKSRCARRVFGRLSVRVNMRQCRPLYGPSIGDVCQIKAYIDLFVSVFLRCARAVRILPQMIRLVGNETTACPSDARYKGASSWR